MSVTCSSVVLYQNSFHSTKLMLPILQPTYLETAIMFELLLVICSYRISFSHGQIFDADKYAESLDVYVRLLLCRTTLLRNLNSLILILLYESKSQDFSTVCQSQLLPFRWHRYSISQ